jgi:hypothetical protein
MYSDNLVHGVKSLPTFSEYEVFIYTVSTLVHTKNMSYLSPHFFTSPPFYGLQYISVVTHAVHLQRSQGGGLREGLDVGFGLLSILQRLDYYVTDGHLPFCTCYPVPHWTIIFVVAL